MSGRGRRGPGSGPRAWLRILPVTALVACGPAEPCDPPDPASLPAGVPGGEAPGPYRMGGVDVHGDTVVVRHDGDLWSVALSGGGAERTLPPEVRDQDDRPVPLSRYAPVFSPGGGRLAFSAGSDAYVLDRSSGRIRRLTYHPRGDVVRGWSPSGDTIVFASFRWKRGDNFQLHAVPADGGTPERLPLPFGYDGAYSPDGSRFVAQLFGGGSSLAGWLSYAGGMSRPLKILDPASWTEVDSVSHRGLQDIEPLWLESGLYFASARGRASAPDPSRPGGFDLHRHRPGRCGGEPVRLTAFEFGGVDAAGADDRTIVLSAEGRLYAYDPTADSMRRIAVRFPDGELGPVDSVRVPVADRVRNLRFGPGGRVLAEVRGDLFLLDRGSTSLRRLTRTPGVRERGAALSPDGSRVAYWSDASGRQRLHVARLEGRGPIEGPGEDPDVRRLSVGEAPGRYRELAWSPDGARLVFSDEALGLWIARLADGSVGRIARSEFPAQGRWNPRWSPDGRFLAYARASASGVRSVHLYDVEDGRHHRVSAPLVDARGPAFDPSGRYLWYFASEHASLAVARDIPYWRLLSSTWARPLASARIRLAVLDPDDPGPLGASGPTDPWSRPGGGLSDPEGVADRVVSLPVERRDVVALEPLAPGAVLVRTVEWPHTPGEAGAPRTPVHHYGLTSPERLARVLDHADEVRVSPDGRALLHRADGRWRLSRVSADRSARPADASPGGGAEDGGSIRVEEAPLDWGGDSITVARMAEWRWIFREAWDRVRTSYVGAERETLDLASLEEHYAAYLPRIRSRGELNELLADMLSHLDLMSHLTVAGGAEWPRPGRRSEGPGAVEAGLLGADLAPDGGRFRFERILRSAVPVALDPSAHAPLAGPGMNVRPGEYLLEVDGRPVTTDRNLHFHLAGTAGEPTSITVGPDPDGADARVLEVVPVSDDRRLREYDWAERNRRRVDEATDGRVGYVWIKGFSEEDIRYLAGALAALGDREALIVDVRFNRGGITSDRLVEILGRTPLYSYDFRHGVDLTIPPLRGPPRRVLLSSQHGASAAETFALMWKRANLGPVVGTRSMGALVGAAGYQPPLVDGGRLLMPNRAARTPDLPTARIEGVGVEPDLVVDWTPAEWQAGVDPQLEAAIRVALEALR